ncbi:MAG: dipeptide epimerase, partial [Alphaproteobacteria bacterium]
PFRISRGEKRNAHLVRVTIKEGPCAGEGECCPYTRYGESIEAVLKTLEDVRQDIEQGLDRTRLQSLLPPGAARNALDCALWDLEAKQTGVPVFQRLGLAPVETFQTMRTVSLDNPDKMAVEAGLYPEATPLKIKLDRALVRERLKAIRKAAPKSPLMIDANESWTAEFLEDVMPILKDFGVVLIEQPLPARDDEDLRAISRLVPVLADEACHTSVDLPRLKGKYDAINIKLDKTGGLTEAVKLFELARAGGFQIMLGCMVSSSLSIAPIAQLCSDADFIDLDGPLLLKEDPDQGLVEINNTARVKITHPWGQI